jgi:endonuclease/exonuclease/phosphatase family metal-dependent hydrolase
LLVVRDWIADLPQPHVLLGDFNLIGAIPGAVLNAAELMRPVHPCGWRDLARRPTYPAHRPIVQFDHVLTHGRAVKVVGTARTPETAVSDHRPLVVDVSL